MGLGAALGVAGVLAWGGCSADRPANVLVYVVDTLRVDGVDAYAPDPVGTPAFDRLAREGVVFDDAFANSTWTRASVGSLFTGRLPRFHGARTRDDVLAEGLPTLAEVLGGHGYATGFVSTNPNVSTVFGFGRGFDEAIELYARPRSGRVTTRELVARAPAVTEAAVAWIDRSPRPFLLVAHTVDPHAPYVPPAAFDRSPHDPRTAFPRDFRGGPLTAADRARVRALYAAEIRANDAAFGALLDALDARGLARDTLVVLTADHGEEFWDVRPGRRGHGNALSDAQLRVPLLMRFPRSPRIAPGTRHAGLVAGVDVLPTVLDLLGLPAPDGLDGRSAFASGAGATTFASAELDGHRLYAIVDPPWKLVRDAARGEERLYRLATSDGNAPLDAPRDTAPVEGHAALRASLRRRLDAHLARSGPAAAPKVGPAALPDGVRETLEALGYLDTAAGGNAGGSRASSTSATPQRRSAGGAGRTSNASPK